MTRSFSDWLTHARAATDPVEAERCLDEAIALARDGWYWAKLLDAVSALAPPRLARVRAIADRALEVTLDAPDVWCFRKVARARATLLDDPAGAHEALELAVIAFDDDAALSSSWPLLAEGFVELGDREGARRALDLGSARARRARAVDDLARLAEAYARLGDPATAAARAEEAEALMTDDGHGAWALAHTWEHLGRGDGAQRVLEAAGARAPSTSAALTVARAWAHHGGAVGQPRAFARAEALAATVADWLAIAATAHELGQPERVRAALAGALAAAGDDRDARAKVAAGYLQWLGDEAAAEAIGPRGWRPEQLLDEPAPALAGWAPLPSGLFDWLRARVPRATLERIASADHGAGYDRHLAALVDLTATGLVPRELDWHPLEVLRLARWQEGDGVDHVARGFAVTLLCLAGSAELDTNGPILVDSALALGPEPAALAAGLVAWCDGERRARLARLGWRDEHDRWALVTLAVLAAAADPDDARLPELARSLASHERRGQLPTELARSQRSRLWHELLARHVRPHAARVPALASVLAQLAAPA